MSTESIIVTETDRAIARRAIRRWPFDHVVYARRIFRRAGSLSEADIRARETS